MVDRAIVLIDMLLRRALMVFCSIMLILMVLLACYVVVMRTVFLLPPFWGDTVTMFANVWFVMLAFALSIRERASISMQVIYNYMPPLLARVIDSLWTVLLGAVGLMLLINGYLVARDVPGSYWELGNLPKSAPMMVLPISGILVMLACFVVIIEDFSGRGPAPGEVITDEAL
jgi:TRAP-type C4-dicarboxylate transport system permease small subunit